ncbi:MAG: helix-turn-helix domain-containing protein [Candidatus Hydrothermarchaeales archaeon]
MNEEKLLILPLNDDTSKRISQTLANETSRRVLEVLCDKPMAPSQISEKLDVPLTTLHYNIDKLLESGLIKIEEIKYSEKGREVKIYSPTRKFIVIAPENIDKEEAKSILRKALFGIYYILAAFGFGYAFQGLYNRYFVGAGVMEQPMLSASMERAVTEELATKPLAAPLSKPVGEPRVYLWFLFGAIFALALIAIWKEIDKKIKK